MQESKLLGTLLPSSPDFLPIIQQIREKFQLPEISPGDDPIEEILLDDEPVSLEDFRQEIKAFVEKADDHLPPEISKILMQAKAFVGVPLDTNAIECLKDEYKKAFQDFYKLAQGMGIFAIKILDQFDSNFADMLYIYILTGESQESPSDWISKVVTASAMGEPVVIAAATQFADTEEIIRQFRKESRKTFGGNRPKVTDKVVSTGYYMQLQRAGKPWSYIVEQFIEINKFSLPRDRNSEQFKKTWNMYSKRLRKRIERSEKILSILVSDKKP